MEAACDLPLHLKTPSTLASARARQRHLKAGWATVYTAQSTSVPRSHIHSCSENSPRRQSCPADPEPIDAERRQDRNVRVFYPMADLFGAGA
jgi:hypothetical protein